MDPEAAAKLTSPRRGGLYRELETPRRVGVEAPDAADVLDRGVVEELAASEMSALRIDRK